MALKVTALTYLKVLKALNAGQKRLYDIFVEIAGYDLNAIVTKQQVKDYIEHKLAIKTTDAEIDEFFKVGKTDSKDTDSNRLTAVEYLSNIHGYPIYEPLKNPLATKIANLDEEIVQEIADWMKRVNGILEPIKRLDV